MYISAVNQQMNKIALISLTKRSSESRVDVGRWNEIEVICHLFV